MILPVILLEVDHTAQHNLQCTIRVLRLPIGLRMVGCAHADRGAETRPERLPEVCSEAWIAITDDALGHAMESHDTAEEQACCGRSIDACLAYDEMLELGQLAHEYQDRVVARTSTGRQTRDKIHRPRMPR